MNPQLKSQNFATQIQFVQMGNAPNTKHYKPITYTISQWEIHGQSNGQWAIAQQNITTHM